MHDIKKQQLKINSLSQVTPEVHKLDCTLPWIQELLDELQENVENPQNGEIKGEITFSRKIDDGLLRDHVLISGKIGGNYEAACVRCLENAPSTFETIFESCFVSDSLEEEPEFAETSHVFADGREMELYFYEKGQIDLKEFLHENIYLNVNPLPLHDPECKGLCPQCGINLNSETCKHQ